VTDFGDAPTKMLRFHPQKAKSFALHLLSKVEKIFPTVPISKSPCAGKGGAELKSKSS